MEAGSALEVLAGGLRLEKVRPRVVGTRDEQADAVGAMAGADRANLRLVRHLEGESVDLRVHERSKGAAGEQRVAPKQKGGAAVRGGGSGGVSRGVPASARRTYTGG